MKSSQYSIRSRQRVILGLDGTAQEPLWELLSRPWFRMVWIIQEAMVARFAVVYCGKRAYL